MTEETTTTPQEGEEKKKGFFTRIPFSLFNEVQLLLMDPRYGKVKFGELSKLVTQLLNEWVEKQRKKVKENG